MIKYQLICKNCDFSFDSWFSSSKEFEKLKNKNFLNCHNCNSKKIEKSLMAPKLINRSHLKDFDIKDDKFKKIKKTIKEYQKFIKNNFEYVGNNFAYEARSIHYNKKKGGNGIYGTATKKEIKELKEEGVGAELIPWIEDKSN
tara:strand:- start:303 stop:731 length:429 start_codon:yes stop_codon:yes gene_type:complete